MGSNSDDATNRKSKVIRAQYDPCVRKFSRWLGVINERGHGLPLQPCIWVLEFDAFVLRVAVVVIALEGIR